jgi:predicted nucleic acid-binding protein
MKHPFLDSNILIRHLTADDLQKAQDCFALVLSIERGEVTVWTSDLVIAEVVFVLTSKRTYNLSRERVRDLILPLIHLPGIKLPHKRLYDRVFELFTSLPLDYIDAYHAALMEHQGCTDLFSYDRHFDAVPGVVRREP